MMMEKRLQSFYVMCAEIYVLTVIDFSIFIDERSLIRDRWSLSQIFRQKEFDKESYITKHYQRLYLRLFKVLCFCGFNWLSLKLTGVQRRRRSYQG